MVNHNSMLLKKIIYLISATIFFMVSLFLNTIYQYGLSELLLLFGFLMSFGILIKNNKISILVISFNVICYYLPFKELYSLSEIIIKGKYDFDSTFIWSLFILLFLLNIYFLKEIFKSNIR